MDRSAPASPADHGTTPFAVGSIPERMGSRAVERVLVSGGAGFIGAELVRSLQEQGVECTLIDDLSAGSGPRLARLGAAGSPPRCYRLDVSEPGVWQTVLEQAGPFDAIVHLAGRVGVRRVLSDPEACRASNVAGVRELVAALEKIAPAQRPRVFAASSSEVYADRVGPLRELSPLRPEDGGGRWAYAASKRTAETVLDAARGLWPAGAGPVHLRFFNVIGPGQDARTGMVMPTFVEHALRGEPLPVHGRGDQVRTFGHVDDVASSLATIVRRGQFPAGALNLGGRTRTSILALARAVIARLDHARSWGSGVESGRVSFVDPCDRISGSFEEVLTREPDLQRAVELGISIPERSIAELVDDCLARHAALSIGSTAERRALVAAPWLPGPEGTHARRGGIACASLGS